MSEPLRASIIITSYNYGRYLPETIDSALAQTYPHTEVIVVDDGSTDNSREVILGYGSRVIPVLKANGGQASAFNAGFRHSGGDVILFLDSDDALLSSAVETAVRCFEDTGVAKVHWPLWEIDERSRRTGRVHPPRELPEGNLREQMIRDGPDSYATPPTTGNAWARWFLERVLPMPEPEYVTCPDGYLAVLAPLFGRLARIPEPQGLYRVHGQNNMGGIFYREKIRLFDHRCAVLQEYLRREGLSVDPEVWKRPYYSWLRQIELAEQDLATVLSSEDTARFILVDEDQFRGEFAAGQRAIPFLQRGGQYWGPPPDDETAIRELERLRRAGARFLAFAWPAFWWLEHYTGFHRHLRSHYPRLLENERLLVFDLRTSFAPLPRQTAYE
ncbi:MAG TPA: glycosyltransferase family A protein [Gemmataceae bacterium]|nr:glycosyltransferase family A protein [Gemmataceae bacterium]